MRDPSPSAIAGIGSGRRTTMAYAHAGAHRADVNRLSASPNRETGQLRSRPLSATALPMRPSGTKQLVQLVRPIHSRFHSPTVGGRSLLQDASMVGAPIRPQAKRSIRQQLKWCPARPTTLWSATAGSGPSDRSDPPVREARPVLVLGSAREELQNLERSPVLRNHPTTAACSCSHRARVS